MKKTILTATLLLAASGSLAAENTVNWGYEGQASPQHWGQLSPEFTLCSVGKNQSPVNIQGALKAQQSALALSFQPGQQEMINNGHTIQVNTQGENTLSLDGKTFTLRQFHFHAPSENTIDGEQFPMEVHFVYQDAEGALAVLGLMFRLGEANTQLEAAWQQMPAAKGQSAVLSQPVDIQNLLPKQQSFYRFSGSLTTPPCSEGVRWLVLKEAVTASAEQVQQFSNVMQHDNNRPVQPLNGRVIIN